MSERIFNRVGARARLPLRRYERPPFWLLLCLSSRNGARGLLLGAFLGMLFCALMNGAVGLLRGLLWVIGLVFRGSVGVPLGMLLGFGAGIFAVALLRAS